MHTALAYVLFKGLNPLIAFDILAYTKAHSSLSTICLIGQVWDSVKHILEDNQVNPYMAEFVFFQRSTKNRVLIIRDKLEFVPSISCTKMDTYIPFSLCSLLSHCMKKYFISKPAAYCHSKWQTSQYRPLIRSVFFLHLLPAVSETFMYVYFEMQTGLGTFQMRTGMTFYQSS